MISDDTKNVVVIGATPKRDRYAFRAVEMLREHGYHAIPVNPAYAEVLGEKCYRSIADVPHKIDTVTLYVGPARSNALADDVIATKPRRIIMNPGAENDELAMKAGKRGIAVVEDCTLVMLRTGRF